MHMDQENIVLRAAGPSIEEGRIFARLLDRASDGFFRFWLGRDSVEILAKAYIQPDHDLSFQYVTFAEHDDVIIGMVSAYTSEQHSRSSDKPLEKAAEGGSFRMAILALLLTPIIRFMKTMKDGDFYVQALAVNKEFNGMGIGSLLMNAAEKQASDSGSLRFTLDVAVQNESARRLYEHRGMKIKARWPKHVAIPVISIYRMVKNIT